MCGGDILTYVACSENYVYLNITYVTRYKDIYKQEISLESKRSISIRKLTSFLDINNLPYLFVRFLSHLL